MLYQTLNRYSTIDTLFFGKIDDSDILYFVFVIFLGSTGRKSNYSN